MTETARELVLRLVERLPDDATLEDIMYELYVVQGIERGLRDVAEGRTVPHEEVKREMRSGFGYLVRRGFSSQWPS